jgi:cytochrome c553
VKTEARCSSVSLAMRLHLAVPFGSEIGQVRIDAMSEAITVFKWLIIANAVIGINACASAQDNDVGKTEYLSSCGACHGIDAKGNGPVSKELKTHPTDLTVLAKNNNGVFPYNTVYEMIDGRNLSIASHGTREMPIWGYRFTPPQAFRFKNRILAVIDYLNRIQEK